MRTPARSRSKLGGLSRGLQYRWVAAEIEVDVELLEHPDADIAAVCVGSRRRWVLDRIAGTFAKRGRQARRGQGHLARCSARRHRRPGNSAWRRLASSRLRLPNRCAEGRVPAIAEVEERFDRQAAAGDRRPDVLNGPSPRSSAVAAAGGLKLSRERSGSCSFGQSMATTGGIEQFAAEISGSAGRLPGDRRHVHHAHAEVCHAQPPTSMSPR